MSPWLPWLVLCLALAAACWWDWRDRRIPNALVVGTLLAGLALQVFSPPGAGLFEAERRGGLGVASAAGAALVMLLAGLWLWRVKLFGAGDAKLLAAVAAFTGWPGVVALLLLTLLAGGILAVTALLLQRQSLAAGLKARKAASPARLPYSLAIAAGALVQAAVAASGKSPWQ